MKRLVYTICMGSDKYVDMLNMCLYSLVKNGKFEDDIVVLCDFDTFDNRYKLKNKNLKFINIKADIEKISIWGMPKIAWYAKTTIFNYVNRNDYNEIMYLDIDTIINRSINPIFDQLKEYPILVQHNDIWLNVEGHLRRLDRVYPLPHIDFTKYNNSSCCSGCFVLSDFKVIDEWNRVVFDAYTKNIKRQIGDQELLHLAIINCGFEFKNIKGVGFQYYNHDTTLDISHFTNINYNIIKKHFKDKIYKNDKDINSI
jgi:hypothetical protein